MGDDRFLGVLDAAVAAADESGIPYGIIGGITSFVMGRARWPTEDIDVFVRPEDAPTLLEALGRHGFQTERTDDNWIFKATRDDIVVDIIFRSEGDIFLDDDMLARIEEGEYHGRGLKLVPPEDVLVMKAIAHSEMTPRYWHDALGIIGRSELDWDYVLRRARQHGARRVLSLLLYAESNDLVVPRPVIESLFETIHRGGSGEEPWTAPATSDATT
ncbi:MAG TPA: nucleotidyltransferase [Actinomycetota bacterium]|nr:nucleotidyltransferase [Actinomycetota bacterium]